MKLIELGKVIGRSREVQVMLMKMMKKKMMKKMIFSKNHIFPYFIFSPFFDKIYFLIGALKFRC